MYKTVTHLRSARQSRSSGTGMPPPHRHQRLRCASASAVELGCTCADNDVSSSHWACCHVGLGVNWSDLILVGNTLPKLRPDVSFSSAMKHFSRSRLGYTNSLYKRSSVAVYSKRLIEVGYQTKEGMWRIAIIWRNIWYSYCNLLSSHLISEVESFSSRHDKFSREFSVVHTMPNTRTPCLVNGTWCTIYVRREWDNRSYTKDPHVSYGTCRLFTWRTRAALDSCINYGCSAFRPCLRPTKARGNNWCDPVDKAPRITRKERICNLGIQYTHGYFHILR